jgi:Flp pilus assembly protein TadD
MRKLFSLCVLVILASSFYGYGQTTNKAAEAALTKGINAAENNDFNTAIINYTKAIELDPKNANAYRNRGIAYKALGKTKEADADFAKAKALQK